MNNILSKRKSACLSVVGDYPFHFRAEMNENVGGNWKKRRHVFLKFVQKILEFVQIFQKTCRASVRKEKKLFRHEGILFV